VRSAGVGDEMSHNDEQLPTLTEYLLTYLNACPSALGFSATLFCHVSLCAVSTEKQGNREHVLTLDTFRLMPVLGALAKLQQVTFSFVMSVRPSGGPSVRMEHFRSNRTDFHEIVYPYFFENQSRKFKFHYNTIGFVVSKPILIKPTLMV
jgi:hypothetical protein